MKPSLLFCHALLVGVSLVVPASAGAQSIGAEQWALLAREGGCHPIASLKRRLADIPDVSGPDAFEKYLSAKGWRFIRKAHPVSPGKAVEFIVESQGLSLLFVTSGLCGSTTAPGKQVAPRRGP